MTYAIEGVPMTQYLPDVPFLETIVIRHPKKVFKSFKKATTVEFDVDISKMERSDMVNDIPILSSAVLLSSVVRKMAKP